MQDMKRTKVNRVQKGRVLKPAEVHSLLAHCNDRLRVIVLLGLLTGLRRAEIFSLQWKDDRKEPRSWIDFENDKIRVRRCIFFRHGKHWELGDDPAYTFVSPKGKQSARDVPLSPVLKKELKAFFLRATDKDGLLFQTANGKPLDPNNVCRWLSPKKRERDSQQQHLRTASTFYRALHRAGIGPLRFHDLRHTYGSTLIDCGQNIYDVCRWMGHSSIQITVDVYGHMLTDRGQEAAAKADAVYFSTAAVE